MLTSLIWHGKSLESISGWLPQKAEELEKLSLFWCEVPPSSCQCKYSSSVSAQQQQKRVHLNSVRVARRRAFAQLGTAQRQPKCFSASWLLVAASQLRHRVWLSVNLDTAITG